MKAASAQRCPSPAPAIHYADLELCAPLVYHDYFLGSEVPFIFALVTLLSVPFG